MASPTVDAVVVGAGPAGSTAALVLARGGARVALVDKATFGRDKACGDLVGTPGAGVAGVARPGAARAVGRSGRWWWSARPGGGCCSRPEQGAPIPDHGVAVTRLRFDAWLRDAAIAAGAEPVTGRVAAVRAGTVELDDGSSPHRRRGDRSRRGHQRRGCRRRPRRPGRRAVGLRPAGYVAAGRRPPDHRPVGRGARARVPRVRLAVPRRGGRRQHRLGTRPASRPDRRVAGGGPLRRLLRSPPPPGPPVGPRRRPPPRRLVEDGDGRHRRRPRADLPRRRRRRPGQPPAGRGHRPGHDQRGGRRRGHPRRPGVGGSPLPPLPGRRTGSVRVGGGAGPRRGHQPARPGGSRSSAAPSPCPASVPPSPPRGR